MIERFAVRRIWRGVIGSEQQAFARLGRMFGRSESPLEAMLDYADARKEELRATPLQWCRPAGRSRDGG